MPFDNPNVTAQALVDSTTTRLLRGAYALIDAPEKWTQGNLCVRRHRIVPVLPCLPMASFDGLADLPVMVEIQITDEFAYCSAGALRTQTGDGMLWDLPYRQAIACLYDALPVSARVRGDVPNNVMWNCLIAYNDDRRWPTVDRWWRRAIDLSVRRDLLDAHRV